MTTATRAPSSENGAPATMQVLLVEDDPLDALLVRAVLAQALKTHQRVTEADTLAAALRLLATDAPACVLLDLNLPDSEGLATIAPIRRAAPDAVIIVLTGLDDDALGREALLEGVDDYLVKGKVDADSLGRSIRYAGLRRSAEARRESENQRFRALIQNSGDIILVVDDKGCLSYASPAGLAILGFEPEAYLGTPALDFVHPEDVPEVLAALTLALETPGPSPRARYRVRHRDGTYRWIESLGNNLLDDPSVHGLVINARDITEQHEAEVDMARLNRGLHLLRSADAALVRAEDENRLLDEMCRLLVEEGGYMHAWLATVNTAGELQAAGGHGDDPAFYAAFQQAYAEHPSGPVAEALRSGGPVVVQDVSTLDPSLPTRATATRFGHQAMAAFPLLLAGEMVGALAVYSGTTHRFSADEVSLLELLGRDLSYGLASLRTRVERSELLRRLAKNLDAIVGTVAATVEYRDPYTAGHQDRVARIAGAIGRELGLDEWQVKGIEMAARIHDLGKISIPAEILSKPGRLGEAELALVKTHAQAGYEILKEIDFPWPVPEMVHQHHERYDGTGYPQGLQGEAIVLGSRIIAVADTIEAMASHRPYRPGLGLPAALVEIERGRGTAFDPDVTDACLRLFKDGDFDLGPGWSA